jgi:hypothetical protein
MGTVAAGIRISLSGLFGPDGRYFEFAHPLTLEVEQDADGVWEHRLPELDIWSFGPTRDDSYLGLTVLLEGDYDLFALHSDEGLGKEALRRKRLLLDCVKSVI